MAGVRVVELTRVWAGPFAGKLLAFLGAEVIRIESLDSLDASRAYGVNGLDVSAGFRAVNPQKLSAQINLKHQEGRDLLLRLLGESDVFIENLRPGITGRLGLGYEAVRAVNPQIVYTAMSVYGSSGPLSYQTGYAPCFVAGGGVSGLVGYEGRKPSGMNIRYGDSTFGAAAAVGTMAALLHRRRHGEGQFVDVSAAETMSTMIGDVLLDFARAGADRDRSGSGHPDMAPHGAYPCGDREWISIATPDDVSWAALAALTGDPELKAPRFATLGGRREHSGELDERLSAWTRTQAPADLPARLQHAGICAAKSQNTIDVCADARLWDHGLFRVVDETGGQTRPIVGPSWRSAREASVTRGAPALGEHNAYVFGDVLGLSEAEQGRLAERGILR
ncbi:hypothetical protein B2G71_15045 [Novosphingobium sp. PC22D]|nr:hypothetical protein B2G71_15045 [Novosphingobium sp. PC22D]